MEDVVHKEVMLGEVYAHINNGGVTVRTLSGQHGAKVSVNLSSFGHAATTEFRPDRSTLLKLAKLFTDAAAADYLGPTLDRATDRDDIPVSTLWGELRRAVDSGFGKGSENLKF